MRSWPLAMLLLVFSLNAAAQDSAQMSATARAIESGADQPAQRLEPDPVNRRSAATLGISEAEIRAAELPSRAAVAPAATKKLRRHSHVRRSKRAPIWTSHYVSTGGGIVIDVSNRLDDEQIGEQLSLFLEGRRVADFELDDRHREAELQIPLPSPGRLRYQLLGATDSVRHGQLEVRSRGCIDIEPGGRYTIRRSGRLLRLATLR